MCTALREINFSSSLLWSTHFRNGYKLQEGKVVGNGAYERETIFFYTVLFIRLNNLNFILKQAMDSILSREMTKLVFLKSHLSGNLADGLQRSNQHRQTHQMVPDVSTKPECSTIAAGGQKGNTYNVELAKLSDRTVIRNVKKKQITTY